MSVNAIPVGARLQLRLVVGESPEGSPVYRTRSYSRVKPLAADDSVHAVGSSLAAMQEHDLAELRRVNEYVLQQG